MKKTLSFVRWKFVLPVGILLAAIVVFFLVFFDPLVAKALEAVGSRANGAKVEIDGFKTSFFKGRVSVARLQVANKEKPMENVIEAGPLVFQADLSEAFSKRVIINDATLRGLAFNAPRKTSGALPKRVEKAAIAEKPSAASKLVEKYQDRFKLTLTGMGAEAKSKIEFDPKDLEIVKQGNALKARTQTLPDEWKKREATLDVDGRLKKAEDELKALRATPTQGTEALAAIPAAVKKLNQVKDELNTLKRDVTAAKDQVSTDISGVKTGVTGLAAAKKKDVDGLLARLNLGFADPQHLIEGMIGPAVLSRVRTALHYIQVARARMPSKKEAATLPAPPRGRGLDIPFPTPAAPPRFWLQHAALEGAYEGIGVAGEIKNATSDPARVGQPTTISLKGAKAAQTFDAGALLDHTGDASHDRFTFRAGGLDAKSLGGDAPMLAALSSGVGAVDMGLDLNGEDALNGKLGFTLSRLAFDEAALFHSFGIAEGAGASKEDALKASFVRGIKKAIEGMPSVGVTAAITGTLSDPDLALSSNLVGPLNSAIKQTVGSLVEDQKKDLEARLDQIVKQQTADIQGKLDGALSGVNGRFAADEARIQKALSDATGLNLSPAGGSPIKIPSLDKFFKH